jgi:ATP-dependent Clp protease protease subunit
MPARRGEIWLYDRIGDDFFGGGISADSFRKELTALGRVSTINVRINSPGGDVFDGLAIYNSLKQHPAQIIVDIDGLAASIASLIAMVGDDIRIAANAMLMIHNPQSIAVGDANEMLRTAALLGQVKGSLADTYAARTQQARSQLEAWMDDETWMNADTAVQYGFADAVAAEQRVAASFAMLERYRNVPRSLKMRTAETPTIGRDILSVRNAEMAQRIAALSPN